MTLVYIALGANLGDRLATLRKAVEQLKALGRVVARSSVWETEPMGPPPTYLNAVIALETQLAPRPLLDALLVIERTHGRTRGEPNAPRTLDLDILLWGDRVVSEPGVAIPHPKLHERRFVLAPLVEIDADEIHPLLQRSMGEFLAALPSQPWVQRIDDPL